MPESIEQIQRDAYMRGQQMKQWHREQQRTVSHEALTILAADFAQVSLFKSNQHFTEGAGHVRAVFARGRFRMVTARPSRTFSQKQSARTLQVLKIPMLKER